MRGEKSVGGETGPRRNEQDELSVLHISSDVYPEVPGGLGLHVHHLLRDQAERGHDVTLLTSDHGETDRPRRENRAGYTVVRHAELFELLGNSICPGIARSVFGSRDEFDVVHLHSHLFFSTNVSSVVQRFDDTKTVLTNHSLKSQTAPMWLQSLFLPTVGRLTFNSVDEIFCYTEADLRRLRKLGVTTDVSLIRQGIDCSLFKPLPVRNDETQILFVGRLTPGKRPHHVVDAFVNLKASFPHLRLKIRGDGPMKPELKQTIRERGVSDSVTFEGYVPYDEMARFYSESSLLVSPTVAEGGNPRVVLEAMACETPVVTTDLPQLDPLIRENVHTVPPDSPSALEAKMGALIADEELRERSGRRGRECVEENFSWEQTVEKTLSAYRDVR